MDDPLSLLAFAVWTLAAGMYPLGFMFGTCSACCCRSDSCEGFDLEEAFSCRSGGFEVCEYEYLGDGKFAITERTSKGCWVSGDGIAFGTRVTNVDQEYEVDEPFVYGDIKGCCRYKIDGFFTSTGTPVTGSLRSTAETEADCEQKFDDEDGGGFITVTNKYDYSWTECDPACSSPGLSGFRSMRRDIISGGRSGPTGRFIVTVDPPPESSPEGCVTFCGRSGLCGVGAFDETFRFGEDQTDESDLRRMCIRWLCRCYVATGKRFEVDPETEEPLFPDPYDWYEVESTTEVGGPVVFGGTITEKLEAAESDGRYGGFEMFEHDVIFGQFGLGAAEDSRLCLVYAFVFYGTSGDTSPDTCRGLDSQNEPEYWPPKTVVPKDVYQIIPCDRCSCQ